MALCPSAQAKGLSVLTKSGELLGSLLGFVIDTERGSIAQLEVRPAGLVRGLVAHELLIGWDAVLEWTDQHILVKDTAIPAPSSVAVSAPSVVPGI